MSESSQGEDSDPQLFHYQGVSVQGSEGRDQYRRQNNGGDEDSDEDTHQVIFQAWEYV